MGKIDKKLKQAATVTGAMGIISRFCLTEGASEDIEVLETAVLTMCLSIKEMDG